MITFRRMQVSTSVKISLIMIKTCQIYAQRLGALTTNWMANYWLCLTIRSRVGGTENWLNMCDGTKTFTLTPKHCKLFLYLFLVRDCWAYFLDLRHENGTRPLNKEPITWQQCERRWHGKKTFRRVNNGTCVQTKLVQEPTSLVSQPAPWPSWWGLRSQWI